MPSVVLGMPCNGMPSVVLGMTSVVLGMPSVILGMPSVVLGMLSIVLGMASVVLDMPTGANHIICIGCLALIGQSIRLHLYACDTAYHTGS